MRLLGVSFLAVACFGAQPRLAWHGDELREGSHTVLVYNSKPQLKPGVPEDRRRCCYIYPLYTPFGVEVLDDFPADHFHHRGLFWAWPVVEVRGKKYDGWMMHGLTVRGEKTDQHSRSSVATLSATNGWYAGDARIVTETFTLAAHPSTTRGQDFDLTLSLEATDAPVTLRGSQEQGKSYGGLSARFAPRDKTVIRTDGAAVDTDEDLVRHHWAELEAVYQGKGAVLRITPSPANLGAPFQWCLRKYGFIGASFPGKTDEGSEYTLESGKPLVMKFRVTVADVP